MDKLKLISVCTILIVLSIIGCSKPLNDVKTSEEIQKENSDDRASIEADSIIALMSFEEKIGQLQQLDGGISKNDLPRLIEEGRVGSVLNEVNEDLVANYQRIALEKSRLGIPLLIGRDVIHGFRTIFPIPLAQSATWNLDIVEEGARIAAEEASSVGVNWTFAPMIDVTRDPRWGRVAESPGEDAYLTTQVGVAMIKGFQGNGKYQDGNIAACAKHFAAYGMAEGGRDYNSAVVGERQLREVYLRPFKAAVDHGVMTFMTSFNEINDVPASGNRFLLRDVLRDEWKFDGVVVSDWESITEMIAHGYCKDEKEAAYKAINAGVDMEMTSIAYHNHIETLVQENKIDLDQINKAVHRILITKIRLGLFENPYPQVGNKKNILSAKSLASARQAASESAVLLKNNNEVLPLSQEISSVAVIGPLANSPYEQMGTWSFDGKRTDSQTPLYAIQKDYPNIKVNYAAGLKISRTKTNEGFDDAIAAANASDIILYFVGEEAILSGEAHSRAHLNLPGAQEELLDGLVKTGKKIVMIVMAGRPLILTDLLPKVDAVLYAWHGGTMAGPGIVDIIMGKANPSAKLPITFPRSVGQIPMYHSHKNTGRPASESSWVSIDDIPVEAWQTSLGNTSHYLDEGFTPLFPFGFGMSYTSFAYRDLKINKKTLAPNETSIISVELTNTGKYNGQEVVQLYVQDLFGSVTRPVKELKGFKKVFLKKGETKTVVFNLAHEDLKFFDESTEFNAEPGKYKVWVGGHSATKDFLSFEGVD